MPLGILFHIAAGNAQGLPFYSVVEGLLTGNINILKLPSGDDGLSVFLLQELVRLKPNLSRHVIVIDAPSTNRKLMQSLGKLADAIVVWGGDEAIREVREIFRQWGFYVMKKTAFIWKTASKSRSPPDYWLWRHVFFGGRRGS